MQSFYRADRAWQSPGALARGQCHHRPWQGRRTRRCTRLQCARARGKAPMTRTKDVVRWSEGRSQSSKDELALEEPLEIQVDTRPVSVTMRTPGHDDELATGFLVTEGIITSSKDLIKIAPHPRNRQNVINLFLRNIPDLGRLKRHVFVSSSCGLCGKASIENVHQHFKPVKGRLRISTDVLFGLPEKLRKGQEAFALSGGLHAAGIFSANGKLIVCREDIG